MIVCGRGRIAKTAVAAAKAKAKRKNTTEGETKELFSRFLRVEKSTAAAAAAAAVENTADSPKGAFLPFCFLRS